jgi:hypothetical protein
MKIANPTYDVVFKYLMEDNDIAKDILSAILDEEINSIDILDDITKQKIARIVRHIGKVILRHSDLLYVIAMEDLMDVEAERERIDKEQIKQQIEEAKIAKIKADLETIKLKREVEALRQQLQKQNNTPSV